MSPRFQLYYYEAPGREELARMILALAGEPFEFIAISDDRNWGVRDAERDVKRITPFGRVETKTEGPKAGEKLILAESRTIERYLAKELNLMGADKYEAAEIDMIVTNMRIYFDKVGEYVLEAPVHLRRMLQMDFRSKHWNEFLESHEKLLVKNATNGHYVGSSTTYADLATFYFLISLKNLDRDLIMDFTEDRYPALTKLFQTVGAEPRVKGYLINIVKPL